MARRSAAARSGGAAGARTGAADAVERLLLDAVARHRAGRLDEAKAAYEQVLEMRPKQADALHLLGLVAHQTGDHAAALPLIRRAIAVNKRDAAYHNSLGAALLALGRTDEAVVSLGRALALKPDYAEAHNNQGNAWMENGRPAEAEACYRRALAAQPGYAVARNNLGSALRRLGRLDEAESAYEAALEVRAEYPAALSNLGRVLHEQGRYGEALERFDRALELDPDHADAHANLGILLLTMGRLTEGFSEYEWRWQARGTRPAGDLDAPLWDGTDLAGRTLFLRAEQGLGSAVHFARYAALLAGSGGRVLLECPRPLARLFAHLLYGGEPAGVELVVKGEAPPAFDVQAPLLSLPHLTGTDAATIPCDVPYLGVDPALDERWRERLGAAKGLRVGLVWSGNPAHENDRNRSMPAEEFLPLLGLEDVTFVSLQIGARERDLEVCAPGLVRDIRDGVEDFADTAAILGHLDLVISVDTAVAHLAGALDRPCWLLVPFVPEWRWQLERADSAWYPSLRLFRQRRPGDWTDVIKRVGEALRTLSSAGPA